MKRKILKTLVFILKTLMVLLIINDIFFNIFDVYTYSEKWSWPEALLTILGAMITIGVLLLFFGKYSSAKLIIVVTLLSIYILMHYYNTRIIYAMDRARCIESSICPEGMTLNGG